MSLENALAENTKALLALTAAMSKSKSAAADTTAAAATKTGKAKPPVDDDDDDDADTISYDEVKKRIIDLGNKEGKGRPAVAAILAKLKVEKGPDLKPEQYAKAIKLFDAELADDDADED